MHVSRSRHFGVALAAATLIATGAAVAGPGGVANAATAVPAGFYGPLDASAPPRAVAPAAAEPAPAEPAAEPAPAPAPPPPAPAPLAVTPDDLARIVPGMPAEKIAEYIAPLNAAMARGGIDNPVRQAAFIAQLAVESDSFRTFEEYASGRAYEGRADLGNTQAGDGERYKGRGAIQITGRHNYESVSQFTGVDFVAHPELLEAPENAFNTAVWYWTSRDLNQVADSAGIVRVSEVVNGGHHALERRVADFQRGLDVLLRP
ncbi:glycoside hydrolase family 19 protein [Rhodococcus maanshanensis]|uniref:Putative chitinase n=1 Tax=Rhodococcus maanshanensis TaxID=183556 RepID=A0A1H7QTQ6_9NOCA|nr:glycoside hydrolase family 19 protein [Rhodococcus maanshanensis]SEL51313.1 putative chitinase [Rhodococcus maanshanensis]